MTPQTTEIDRLEGLAFAMATPAQLASMVDAEARETELLTIVRRELFAPFAVFTKRVRLRSAAISHSDNCQNPQEVTWSTTRPENPLGGPSLRRMHAMADQAARHPWLAGPPDPALRSCKLSLEQRYHHGICRCGAEIGEHAVLVTIYWAGRKLTREYRLTPDQE